MERVDNKEKMFTESKKHFDQNKYTGLVHIKHMVKNQKRLRQQ